jgi:Tetratricopeptide repeat
VSSIPTRYDCLGNLALLRRRAGCLTEARALGEQALAGREKRLTRDHHFSFAVAVNLVCGLAELDETEEVRKLGERTLRRMHELSGDDHPFTLGCAVNLVTGSADRRRLGSSTALPAQTMERYFVRLGSARRRPAVWPRRHPNTVSCREKPVTPKCAYAPWSRPLSSLGSARQATSGSCRRPATSG